MLRDLFLSVTNPFATSRSLSKSLLVLPSREAPDDPHRKLKRSNSLEKNHYIARPRACRRHDSGPIQRLKSNSLPRECQLAIQSKSPSNTYHAHPSKPINILVIGARGVGKSALLVRFITKRYIGEYMSGKKQTYNYSSSIGAPIGGDQPQQVVVFQDENSHRNGERCMDSQLSEENLSWADGVIMVYDVGEERSFDYAVRAIRLMAQRISNQEKIERHNATACKPVLLLGNKTDIITRRIIKEDDVKMAEKDFPNWVCSGRVSAAEEYEEIANHINDLIAYIRELREIANSSKSSRHAIVNMLRHWPSKSKPEVYGDSKFYC